MTLHTESGHSVFSQDAPKGHDLQPSQSQAQTTSERDAATAEPQGDSCATQPQLMGICTQGAAALPLSKNALKRIRRQQEWEEGRDDRRKRRKEKRQGRRQRLREERKSAVANGAHTAKISPTKVASTTVPMAVLVDCDFDAYMTDKEHTSLAGQVTRCYSDNRNARYGAHLWIAGWTGKIRHRFQSVLGNQHQHWKGVGFVEGDFLACAEAARAQMRDSQGGPMIKSLQRSLDHDASAACVKDDDSSRSQAEAQSQLNEAFSDVVYLTSESPYTLQRLEPHTCYVVGGLVDRNREKGLCYRRARERGIRTAKLPIGQFMVMHSRQVLATNHVVEIMLKWLECGDWAEAFLAVIPKRKGGKLIGDESPSQESGDAGIPMETWPKDGAQCNEDK
ncbi:hypothetical protein CDD81_1836 [Ophiocordyceps australis]|uniref:tRNA (guanine(9)-N1)-methyltransferase n=1 Tax=Ophiocordyceps australis TaxID=1399860 RepID=A0A2C5Y0E9_9HYPO|nr:hypothetical protein CDD81_1836 [Ophiocordyceps australis]